MIFIADLRLINKLIPYIPIQKHGGTLEGKEENSFA